MTPAKARKSRIHQPKTIPKLYPLFKAAQFASIPPVRGTILTYLQNSFEVRSASNHTRRAHIKGQEMRANKKEIEIFYKTHNLSIKEVATHYKIPYRTLAHWVKQEGWESASAIKNITHHRQSFIQDHSDKVLDIAQVKMKKQIKENLGDVSELDSVILDNLLQSSTDEILLKAMNLNYIQKNITLCAVLAKSQLLNLTQSPLAQDPKNAPIVITCAEKVAKIFSDMKLQLYGKDAQISNDNAKSYENMSTQELEALINALD